MKLKPFKRMPVLIAFGAVLAVCVVRLTSVDLLERLESVTYDARARLAAGFPAPVATNLGFVFIDQASIHAVREGSVGFRGFGLYWPRQVYGRLVNELAQQGAKAVAFDVIFADLRPDHPPVQLAGGDLVESDEYFALEMSRATNVVLALTGESGMPELFATNAAALGDISTTKDSDGILRRVRAFQTWRQWHPLFRKLEADPAYGVDLSRARVEPQFLALPRSNSEVIRFPLAADGTFALADLVGDLPAGMPARARPFVERRVWHLGVVLAAFELGLDLPNARVDLGRGRIELDGAGGLTRALPVDRDGFFYIDWRLAPNDPMLTQEPVHAVLAQNRLRLLGQTNDLRQPFAGKLVLVGSAAQGNDLTDFGATPLQAHTLLASKHWNVANGIIANRFVTRVPLKAELAIMALLGALVALLTWNLKPVTASVAVLCLVMGYTALALILYVKYRYWIPLFFPVLGAMGMTHLFLVIWQVVFEQADKRRVRSIFSTMLSPKIVNELLDTGRLELGGTRREVTVLFADVRDFTEFTDRGQERVTDYVEANRIEEEAARALFDEQAREALGTINRYLGCVADTVIQHDGTLDKYIGDCVMAFWGAPTTNPRHASACVRAAIEAQRAIACLNEERAVENARRQAEKGGAATNPLPLLQMGTGINTGTVTVGLMGSEAKTRNYTVFGREVNLASRLEAQSGSGRIFIGERTYEHLLRDDPELAATCVALAPLTVKGFRAAVSVYEVPWRNQGLRSAAGMLQDGQDLQDRTAADTPEAS